MFKFFFHMLSAYFKKKIVIDERKITPGVVVSFTTTPVRINKIWPTINSILLQSQLPSKIYLWIPKQYKRFNNDSISYIPKFLKNNPLVQVEYIEKDWGPATKLLPCLDKFKTQKNTKIIIIDDDRIYHENFIKDLVHYSENNSEVAVTIAGILMSRNNLISPVKNKKICEVDIMEGFSGYLVKPKFFSTAIFNYPVNCPSVFFEDDVWISGHLMQNGIKKIKMRSLSSIQNWMIGNIRSYGLHKHENKGHVNFKQAWAFFQNNKQI